jgi:hypothetical protein
MNVRISIALAILMFAAPCRSQDNAPGANQKPAPAAHIATQPADQHFYYHSWHNGEIKICETYSGVPGLVVCNSDDDIEWRNSFLNMIADNQRSGKTEEQSYRQALDFASKRGKTFSATFSEDPWPKPQTGLKLSTWTCKKDKIVTCDLGGHSM